MAKIISIKEYPLYSISQDGCVFRDGKQLHTYKDKRGYHSVYLYDGHNNRKYMQVHRLVMLAHQPIHNPSDMTVNHKDGIKSNNDISNLEWMTRLENTRHAFKTGLYKRENMGNKKGKSYAIAPELLKKIIEIYKESNISIRQLAILYGVGIKTLNYQIKKNNEVKV